MSKFEDLELEQVAAAVFCAARDAGANALREAQAKQLLRAFGVRVPRGIQVALDQSNFDLPQSSSNRYVVKIDSASILHKSDSGGVRLNLRDRSEIDEAMRATRELPDVEGWLVEEMAGKGIEVLIGAVRHPRFGPLIVVGLGGVLVEYLGDVSMRICPIDRTDAVEMLGELRTAPILDGVRGQAAVDKASLVDILLAIAGADGLLMRYGDQIAELDVNPVIVNAEGAIAVDARLILTQQLARPEEFRPVESLYPLLEPKTIAVAGASAQRTAPGNLFIRHIKNMGFDGDIYPVHPQAESIEGIRAYPSLAEVPAIVDYCYLAVGADACAPLLRDAPGKLRFVQVMAGGFAEREGGEARERELVEAAQVSGARLIGPNTMGIYSPRGRVTYIGNVPEDEGCISIVSQSGGLCTDIIRRGSQRGLKFRSVVSVGNSADVGAAEMLPALLDDEATEVIGLYLEDPHRGRHLFETLRAARGRKPVVMLVGGQTAQGSRAARSHTGALAADERAWQALERQTGVPVCSSLDELIDVLVALQNLRPSTQQITDSVLLFGNGGGTSVLAADAFGREGLRVEALAPTKRAQLAALQLPAGASIENPIDVPANVLAREDGAIARRIIDAIFDGGAPRAVVIHVNVPVILGYPHADVLGNLMQATLDARARDQDDAHGSTHLLLVLRSDGELEMERLRGEMAARALAAGIPVFHELSNAARALSALGSIERAWCRGA